MSTASGSTEPGIGWKQYESRPNGIYIDVNCSSAGFTTTPLFFTSLGGRTRHWRTQGATSIYQPTKLGFRIYLLYDGDTCTPQDALEWGWFINWTGIET